MHSRRDIVTAAFFCICMVIERSPETGPAVEMTVFTIRGPRLGFGWRAQSSHARRPISPIVLVWISVAGRLDPYPE